MIAIDSETTGKDFYHGSKPFLVTTCFPNGKQMVWEWDVDPFTRQPEIPLSDVKDIQSLLDSQDFIVGQNLKFDCTALEMIGVKFPWHKVHDTLIAAHLLASNHKHGLDSLSSHYLVHNIRKYEDSMKLACKECRGQAKRFGWRVASYDDPLMPSIKKSAKEDEDKAWKYDTWLPRAIARHENFNRNHPYWDITRIYANVDSSVTWALWSGTGDGRWHGMEEEIKRRRLWEIYLERLKCLPVAYRMERDGVTVNMGRLKSTRVRLKQEAKFLDQTMVRIARGCGYDLQLPKGATNDSLHRFVFGSDGLNLPVTERTDKGKAKFDKGFLDRAMLDLDKTTSEGMFINALARSRKKKKDISDLDGYERFALPLRKSDDSECHCGRPCPSGFCDICNWQDTLCDWALLHPGLNPTGSDHLRWSHQNPNEANVKKGKDGLRVMFGPPPDEIWLRADAENIELRIPSYEANEREFIKLFERPKDPPYYGSNHLLIAHLLHKQLFEECRGEDGEIDGRIFKKRYDATWYQWTKNFDFCVQYGGGRAKADKTAHRDGAYDLVKSKFAGLAELDRYWMNFAKKHGYVETIRDTSIGASRGYPILAARTEFGGVLSTTPLNYHVSGTAMWWTMMAMIRCQEYLDNLNASIARLRLRTKYRMVLQVHDELVFAFPKREEVEPGPINSRIARDLIAIMAGCGKGINIPTPVSGEFCLDSWASGVSIPQFDMAV